MPTLVKICGLKSEAALEAAIAAGADFIGLVHFAPSPRHLDLPEIARLSETARGRVKSVVLSVDADEDTLLTIAREARPDYLQLHGQEPPERLDRLKAQTGLGLIKAIGVAEKADLARLDAYPQADILLLDAKPGAGDTRPGGLGRAFDWELLAGMSSPAPVMLSGGLDPDNVGEAIARARPFAVDVSSGVEAQKGVKDPDRIRAFIAAVRSAAAA